MQTQLILNIDNKSIEMANNYANNNNITIDKLVEFYLKSFEVSSVKNSIKYKILKKVLKGIMQPLNINKFKIFSKEELNER